MRSRLVWPFWIATLVSHSLVASLAAQERVLVVPSKEFPTIQSALKISSGTGWPVEVAPGVYREELRMFGAATLRSREGPARTIIDGSGVSAGQPALWIGTGSCKLQGFTVRNGAAGVQALSNDITIDNCVFESNTGIGGIVIRDITSTVPMRATVTRCVFARNSGSLSGGAVYYQYYRSTPGGPPSVLSFEDCVFDGNRAGSGAAIGDTTNGGAVLHLDRCVFVRNQATAGGSTLSWQERVTLTNCSFVANGTMGSLGTVALWSGARADITNCTFALNVGPDVYAGVFQSAVAPIIRITNSILWSTIPAIVLAGSGSTMPVAKVSHCDVLGGYAGRGNINANPQFLSTASGNVRLLATSPCRDRGDTNANGVPRTDFEGDPRRIGSRVDIGADEYDPLATQLWGNLAQLSVSRGGNYALAGSGGKNGEFGVLLATLSGTVPGFDAGGVHVPVNLDVATGIVLTMPGAVARFQASGRWSASLAFPPGMPRELAGKDLHCVLLRVLPAGVTTGVSNVERLVLVP